MATDTQSTGLQQEVSSSSIIMVNALALNMQGKKKELDAENWTVVSMDLYRTSILCSNARAPVAQLVRATHWHSENPGSNPGAGSQHLLPG